jgi:hypothetical protein
MTILDKHAIVGVTAMMVIGGSMPPQVRTTSPSALTLSISANPADYQIGTNRSAAVTYRIVNSGQSAVYVPKDWEVTACLHLGGPHVNDGLISRTGQSFFPGYGASCGSTPGVPLPSVVDRIHQGATLLRPGESLVGHLSFVPMSNATAGSYDLKVVVRGWQREDFSAAEWDDLAKLDAPILSGELSAAIPFIVTAPLDARFLLEARGLNEQIGQLLVLRDSAGGLVVELYGQSVRYGQPFTRPFSGMAVQVWLLRRDGTTVTRHGEPGHVGIGNAGESTDIMTFGFADVPSKDLAAVVVSIDGAVMVRSIGGS